MGPLRKEGPVLHVDRRNGLTVVRLGARAPVLEEIEVEALGRRLYALADEGGRGCLVLDLAGLEGMSSALLAKLIGLRRRVGAAGGRLALCRVEPYVYAKIFEVHRLAPLFDFFADEDQAQAAFARERA
jgi:anti-anti-sigma factor